MQKFNIYLTSTQRFIQLNFKYDFRN